MAEKTDADVVVVGMGPGGEETAGLLAEAGLDVVGVERELLGGECPNWGCIPSKMMIRAGSLLAEGRRIPGMAGDSTITADWAPVARRIREATDSWNDQVAVDRFVGTGGRFVRGAARVTGPGAVAVGDETFHAARAIVLGTGTSAAIPPIPGLADVPYWTNRAAIETEEVPASLAVLGGGAIGMELAQVFSRFGAKVTVVEAAERVLPLEEPESSQLIERVFLSEGIDVITGAKVEAVGERGGRIVLTTGGAAAGEISADRLLVATGRRTDLAALGVGSIGVDESARFLPVDERMRVGDGVWAVGDITGKGLFTHMAVYQARIAVADILGEEGPPASYHAVSRVTFTDPEIGSVGLSEREAREQGLRVRTRVYELPRSARGWIHKVGNDGIVKLVEDAGAGHLVGATTAGPSGGEMLGLLALAVHARIPTPELETMIYAYPTFHRAIGDAVREMLSGT